MHSNFRLRKLKILNALPLKYQAKTPHGEHIYFGGLTPTYKLGKDRIYPLGGLLELGSFGSLTYNKENRFKNILQLNGSSSRIQFMEQNLGIHIDGVKSFMPGAAKSLIRRLYLIAKIKGAKYIYIEATNQKMEAVVKSLGFLFVGTDITNSKVYLKII